MNKINIIFWSEISYCSWRSSKVNNKDLTAECEIMCVHAFDDLRTLCHYLKGGDLRRPVSRWQVQHQELWFSNPFVLPLGHIYDDHITFSSLILTNKQLIKRRFAGGMSFRRINRWQYHYYVAHGNRCWTTKLVFRLPLAE